jgi:hypothetical protein
MRYTDINLTLTTDENGRFGPKQVSIFRCETLKLTVSAAGSSEQTFSFLADKELSNSIPDDLVVTLQPK